MSTATYTIATDLSLDSRRAATVAARLAARTHATLDFFCAFPAAVVDERGIDLERARASVNALARRHAEGDAETTAHVAVVRDVPDAILRHVRRSGASLLVLAPHGVTGWKKVMLGSVTERVLRRATGSVLVARGEGADAPGPIVAGIDRGPGAAQTLRHAVALARALGVALTVVHVVERTELSLPLVAPVDLTQRGDAKHLAAVAAEFERWVATFPHRGVSIEVRVPAGGAAESIVGEARRRGAGLVVVGRSGASRLRRAVLGSVAHAVASTCPTSVLLVR